jgi:hypothetical protein
MEITRGIVVAWWIPSPCLLLSPCPSRRPIVLVGLRCLCDTASERFAHPVSCSISIVNGGDQSDCGLATLRNPSCRFENVS